MTKETFNSAYIKAKYDAKVLITAVIIEQIEKKDLGLTRAQVAKNIELPVSVLNSLYRGQLDSVSIDTLVTICDKLQINVSADTLIQDLLEQITALEEEQAKKKFDIFADIPGLSEEERNILTFKANLTSIIVHELTARKLTRTQAAELMDVSVSVVGLYYRADVMRMNLETVIKSCMRLGIKPIYSYTPKDSPMMTVSIGKM